MQPLGWFFFTVAWVAIITALVYCLGRVLRPQAPDGKAQKGRTKND